MVKFGRHNTADVAWERERERAVFLTFATLPNFIRQAKGACRRNLRRECAHGHAHEDTRSQLSERKRESERGREHLRRPRAYNGCREKQSRGKSATLGITSCTGKCCSRACVRVFVCSRTLCPSMCVCRAVAQVHAPAGSVLSWNTPLTVTVTATYEHRTNLLSCDGLLQCVKSCLYTAGEEKRRERRCGRNTQNRQAFNTAQAHDCVTNTKRDSCFTVLSQRVEQWVCHASFALWSLFPRVKLLPHTHTHTCLPALSRLFTICVLKMSLISLVQKREIFVKKPHLEQLLCYIFVHVWVMTNLVERSFNGMIFKKHSKGKSGDLWHHLALGCVFGLFFFFLSPSFPPIKCLLGNDNVLSANL